MEKTEETIYDEVFWEGVAAMDADDGKHEPPPGGWAYTAKMNEPRITDRNSGADRCPHCGR